MLFLLGAFYETDGLGRTSAARVLGCALAIAMMLLGALPLWRCTRGILLATCGCSLSENPARFSFVSSGDSPCSKVILFPDGFRWGTVDADITLTNGDGRSYVKVHRGGRGRASSLPLIFAINRPVRQGEHLRVEVDFKRRTPEPFSRGSGSIEFALRSAPWAVSQSQPWEAQGPV